MSIIRTKNGEIETIWDDVNNVYELISRKFPECKVTGSDFKESFDKVLAMTEAAKGR